MTVIRELADIINVHELDAEIIAAVRAPPAPRDRVRTRGGATSRRLPFKVLRQMVHHPLTTAGIAQFKADWAKVQPSSPPG